MFTLRLLWVLKVSQNPVSCVVHILARGARAAIINETSQFIAPLVLYPFVLGQGLRSRKRRPRARAQIAFKHQLHTTLSRLLPIQNRLGIKQLINKLFPFTGVLAYEFKPCLTITVRIREYRSDSEQLVCRTVLVSQPPFELTMVASSLYD